MRFPEFDGEWEKYNVSDILNTFPTNSLSWDNLSYKCGKIKNIHYGLIHNGFDTTCVYTTNKIIPFIKDGNFPLEYTLLKTGDLILADASENRKDVGRPIEIINDICENIISGLHTIHARDESNIAVQGFKGFYFQSKSMKSQIYRIANGSKIYGISPSNFKELHMCLPDHLEQEKIVVLLRKIETRIQTQSKIIEDYIYLNKCIINELIINLEEYTECYILDIAKIGRGRVISSKEINKQLKPIYPVYSSQTSKNGIMGYLDQYEFDGEYITWTTDGANAGTVYYRNGKFNCTNVCGTLKINKENDTFFVSKVLSCTTSSYVSKNLANPKLMNNVMAKIKIKLPSLDKQREFSKIIKSIEKKIKYEKDLLDLLKSQKNYFLKNLFI